MRFVLVCINCVKSQTLKRALTNLEFVALAHLAKIGPCTAHELRKAFADSTSGRYSGSAGAIYPLVRRLEKAGLVSSTESANGAQQKRLYKVLRAGRRAIRDWLEDLQSPDIFPDDPLRTRMQYIYMLAPDEQLKWIDNALLSLDAQDDLVREEYAAPELRTVIDQLILKGVLDANKLRRVWLREARNLLLK